MNQLENTPENKFKVGDRVTRRKINSFRYHLGDVGTIVKLVDDSYTAMRYHIKWDTPASTNQQHSTISERFIELAP